MDNTTNGLPEDMTLEQGFSAIDEILDRMEGEELSLEDAFSLYERGIHLLAGCKDKITSIEQRIEALSADGVIEKLDDGDVVE